MTHITIFYSDCVHAKPNIAQAQNRILSKTSFQHIHIYICLYSQLPLKNLTHHFYRCRRRTRT